jgi:glucans biosynthesis protein
VPVRPNRERSGLQCRSPAGRVSRYGRMRGAAGGAPKGNRNAFKHGGCSTETLALKREIQALVRMARETMGAIE